MSLRQLWYYYRHNVKTEPVFCSHTQGIKVHGVARHTPLLTLGLTMQCWKEEHAGVLEERTAPSCVLVLGAVWTHCNVGVLKGV